MPRNIVGLRRLLFAASFAATLLIQPLQGATTALASGSANPMLHRQDTTIVDGNGDIFRPRGVNLGGWLMWEGYIFGAGLNVTQSMIQQKLTGLVGSTASDGFTQEVYASYISDADFARIAQLGFNTVRLPINYRLLEDDSQPYVYKASGWAALDNALNEAEAHGLKVVLDLHAAAGGQSTLSTADPEPVSLWSSQSNQARTVALWTAIAAHVAQRTSILGFDLLNEPNPPTSAQLGILDQQIVSAIRQVDAYHMVILEGAGLSGDFSAFTGLLTDNEAYSFHLYANCSTCSDLRAVRLNGVHYASSHLDVPLYVGEFGENSVAWDQSTEQMLESPTYGVAGWTFWTWKREPVLSGTPNLVVVPPATGWKYMEGWLTSTNMPAPSVSSAQSALNAFIQAAALQPAYENTQLESALHTGW